MIKRFEVSELNTGDQVLADFLREQGIRLVLPCGGNGTCGKCNVEIRYCSGCDIRKKIEVLSCQTTLKDIRDSITDDTDAVEIRINNEKLENNAFYRTAPRELKHNSPWYAAVDLGSTTIETMAITTDGSALGSVRMTNPERSYGADVLSRIRAASEGSIAASDMQRLAESTIQSEISELSERYGLDRRPEEVAIAGNTTMEHLLTGDDVTPLGHAPFDAGDISLRNISSVFYNDGTPVYLMPGITAFVGADILSGMYYLDMDKSDKCNILLDLGTNGEMAAGDSDGFIVASTAAGPAFEAANISCGCAGVPHAISKVTFLRGKPVLTLIPGEDTGRKLSPGEQMQQAMINKTRRPAGLCGSGLISAVAAMKKAGIIDSNGTYTKDYWIRNGYPLWKPLPSSHEDEIRLTQDDIRELLMAKSAIASGLEVITGELEEVPDTIYLAGGFGAGIDVEAARTIGLFPESLKDATIIPVGNTSLKGAEKFLYDDRDVSTDRLTQMADKCNEIRLGDSSAFEKLYIKNLAL